MMTEEFKSACGETLPIGKLISVIARNKTIYLNHELKEYGINASQLQFLFEIELHEEINQDRIASRCSINKGAVARSIRKLEENGFVKREIDINNRRQNKVSLTPKGEATLSKAHEKLDAWEEQVLKDSPVEKGLLQEILKQMTIKSIELNHKGEYDE
jgi:DNA-binding MarR family transcriptional regulator